MWTRDVLSNTLTRSDIDNIVAASIEEMGWYDDFSPVQDWDQKTRKERLFVERQAEAIGFASI